MKNGWQSPLTALALAAGLTAAPTPAAAAVDPYDGNWHLSVTPYLWLPTIHAEMNGTIAGLRNRAGAPLGDVSLRSEVGPGDYLQHLKFALMVTAEARKGRWSILTDIVYTSFGNEKARVFNLTTPRGRSLPAIDTGTEANASSTVWTLAGSYTLARQPDWHIDLLAGARYLGSDLDLKWRLQTSNDLLGASGRLRRDNDTWDPIIGLKGQFRFGSGRWFVPYYVDIGGTSNNYTWQALLGLGYSFGWGDLSLSMRNLSYHFDQNDMDFRQTGPALGVSFHW